MNPATGETTGKHKFQSLKEVTHKLKLARTTFERVWRAKSVEERASYLLRLAHELRSRKREYAKLITTEMGKTITQSEAEVEKCAWTAEVYANNATEWLKSEVASTDAQLSYVRFQPLGVVLSIMPWNFPFWQVFRFAIPALVAGNTSVLRHSNICPRSSLAIAEVFEAAGFPQGVFTSVITNHEVSSNMIASGYVQGVSFTGSVQAGSMIGQLAAKNLKKFVLELGGSDPFIVLEDADVEKAAKVGANARLICSGQSCIAAKRFIVSKSIAKDFTEKFVDELARKKVGDPLDPQTDVGPLCSTAQVRTVDLQVKDAIRHGARPTLGAKRRPGVGAYYEPTVLEDVKPDMAVATEEVFGPVAPIWVVNDEDAAMRIANGTEFGLGSSIWTSDPQRARVLAERIDSGIVFVNELVKSDPRMPFGGVKKSGIGRELSKYGLREFVNVKSVNIFGMEAQTYNSHG